MPKISYAASISQPNLSPKAEQVYKEHLKDFFAISVREKNAVDIIKKITQKEIDYVLDPTLLLKREQWEMVASDRLIRDSYVFCYFLGGDNEIRNIAKEYAKKHNLTLVNMRHAAGHYHKADIDYGDIKMDAPSPNDFLSFIKDADMVFTDSFHASVFSLMFQRQFFVFERDGHKNMSTRITSLMELFETDNRFCNTVEKMTVEYICQQPSIDYIKERKLFEQMKNTSIAFLENNLKKAAKRETKE